MAKKKKRTGVSKAEALTVQRRVDELVRIRLDGAQFHDVREYVSEQQAVEGSPWRLADGASPMSDKQLGRYVKRADTALARHGRASRCVLIYRHLARRENLYAKAVLAGDLRTALAVLADAAQLRGLYPAAKVKASVKHTGVIAFVEVAASAGLDTDPDQGADPSPHRNGCAT